VFASHANVAAAGRDSTAQNSSPTKMAKKAWHFGQLNEWGFTTIASKHRVYLDRVARLRRCDEAAKRAQVVPKRDGEDHARDAHISAKLGSGETEWGRIKLRRRR
jgi:hypothetical protein